MKRARSNITTHAAAICFYLLFAILVEEWGGFLLGCGVGFSAAALIVSVYMEARDE